MAQKYRFSVRYRHATGARVYRLTVTAESPDDARFMAAMRDPEYHSSLQVKRRAAVVEVAS